MYGWHKPSPATSIHWPDEWAKRTFENFIYKRYTRYNKRDPAIVWGKRANAVYYGNQPQTSDVERDVNLTIQATLRIVTKNPAATSQTPGVKWQ